MIEKQCFKCLETKPIDQFYKHRKMAGGILNKCKECAKLDARVTRNRRVDYYRQYDRERGNRQSKDYRNEWREKYPNKYEASALVNRCVKAKKLFPEPCEVCGSKKTVAHHDDYLKPLNVRWLCQAHHKQWHAKHGPGKNGCTETLEEAGLGETPNNTPRYWLKGSVK